MSSTPAPRAWIERLFDRLSGMYGHRFTDMWAGIDPDTVIETWAAGLAGFSLEELLAGFTACGSRDWPPTLPEFRKLCRPPPSYEAAFYEAADQIRRRDMGEDSWSHPAVYWAAMALGGDIRSQTYSALKVRWQRAMDDAINDVREGRRPTQVPQARMALPGAGEGSVSRDVAKAHVAEMRRILGVA